MRFISTIITNLENQGLSQKEILKSIISTFAVPVNHINEFINLMSEETIVEIFSNANNFRELNTKISSERTRDSIIIWESLLGRALPMINNIDSDRFVDMLDVAFQSELPNHNSTKNIIIRTLGVKIEAINDGLLSETAGTTEQNEFNKRKNIEEINDLQTLFFATMDKSDNIQCLRLNVRTMEKLNTKIAALNDNISSGTIIMLAMVIDTPAGYSGFPGLANGYYQREMRKRRNTPGRLSPWNEVFSHPDDPEGTIPPQGAINKIRTTIALINARIDSLDRSTLMTRYRVQETGRGDPSIGRR